jgi:hypothetical protein
MDSRLLSNLGRIAGIGGIALGVLFLLFKGVLGQKLSISPPDAYLVIQSLMTFTFGIAGIGIVAWLISRAVGPTRPVPLPALTIIAALFVVVIGGSGYVARQHVPHSELPSNLHAVQPVDICIGSGEGSSCYGPGVVTYSCDDYKTILGGGSDKTLEILNERFCSEGTETAKQNVKHNFSIEGGKCGWTSFTVTCSG